MSRGATVVGLLALGAGSWPSAAAAGPGFDCKAARTPVETAICGDDGLSALDAALAAAFAPAYAAAADMKPALLAGQRTWLARRVECATRFINAADREPMLACLRGRYLRRIAFLKRPMDLRAENVCHTLTDAITAAHGYADPSGSYSIIADAATDTMGAITLPSASGVERSPLFAQADKRDHVEEASRGAHFVGPNFYLIGPPGKQLVASESYGGEIEEQDEHFYAVEASGGIGGVDGPPDAGGGYLGDYIHFADVPSGGAAVRASYVQETPTLDAVQLAIGSWTGARWYPICSLAVRFAVAFEPVRGACEKAQECAGLSRQALALAVSGGHAGGFTEVREQQRFADDGIPSEKGWHRIGPGEAENRWSFGLDNEPVFALDGTDLLFRLAHGMARSRMNDGAIVGVYRRTAAGLQGVAGFEVPKARTGLAGPVEVTVAEAVRLPADVRRDGRHSEPPAR